MVRPPRFELGLKAPEAFVISLSLRALLAFLTLDSRGVN